MNLLESSTTINIGLALSFSFGCSNRVIHISCVGLLGANFCHNYVWKVNAELVLQ